MEISITHNKNRISLLNLLINCISARPAPQIFSIKDKCIFLVLNFLIISLCDSSANYLFKIFSFLIPLPANLFRVARVATVCNCKFSNHACPAKAFFIKKTIDHWSNFTLISIIFCISSKIKFFITQYFIRSCSFS